MERPELPDRLNRKPAVRIYKPSMNETARGPVKFPEPSSFPPLKKPDNEPPASENEEIINPPIKSEPISSSKIITQRESDEAELRAKMNEMQDDSEAVNFFKFRKNNRKRIAKKEIGRWKKRTLIATLSILIPATIALVLLQFHIIPSNSMSPSVETGDLLVSFRFSNLEPNTGDVVVFDGSGTDWGNEYFLKRVVGVGGEEVSCCDPEGRVLINGESLEESYLKESQKPASSVGFNVNIEDHSFFALGDNRNSSKDSRYFFTQSVPNEKIIAKPFLGINISKLKIYNID